MKAVYLESLLALAAWAAFYWKDHRKRARQAKKALRWTISVEPPHWDSDRDMGVLPSVGITQLMKVKEGRS